jgi:cyclic-di-AMP phosphodiesterase PgpH
VLARPPDEAVRPTRREALRLFALAGALLVMLTAILGVDLSPRYDLQVGDLAPTDIKAPRALSFTNEILTQQQREAARAAVPPQYDYTSDNAIAIASEQLDAFRRRVTPLDTAFAEGTSLEQRQALIDPVAAGLSKDAAAALNALPPDRWAPVRTEAARVLDVTERAELRDTEVASTRQHLAEMMAGNLSDEERNLAAELIAPLLLPNSSYSASLTSQEQDRQAAAVTPVVEHFVQGEVVVRGGTKLSDVDLARIQALGLDAQSPDFTAIVGWLVLSGLLVGIVAAWLWSFRRAFWHRNNVLLLLGLLIVLATIGLKLTAGRAALPFILPLATVGVLVAVLLDAEAGVVVTGILAIRRGDRLQTFVQAGVVIFVVQALVVTAFSLLGERDLAGVIQLIGAAGLSAAGATVAALGSFAVLGNVFGLMTVFQLLELANPSQPLLRRLLVETPGTYHHSLMVGNLAERAAEVIGADPLIARVAAYYHDIGKLANPAAFIENQAGGENLHDQLDPESSAQVLKQHVADGINLAYENRLPKALIAFIPQHHGTAIMSYFYAKAREEAAAPFGGLDTPDGRRAADAVDQRRFRHAGPKPQSREAALLMLSDGVEASVRSLSSRDEPAIRAMVGRIVSERMEDGQFDECNLTLRDISRVEESFVQQLLGMYHQRIAYPQNKVVELESRRAAGTGGGSGG